MEERTCKEGLVSTLATQGKAGEKTMIELLKRYTILSGTVKSRFTHLRTYSGTRTG